LSLLVENFLVPESLGEFFSNPTKDHQMAYKLKTISEMEKKFSFLAGNEVIDVVNGPDREFSRQGPNIQQHCFKMAVFFKKGWE